MFPLHQITKKRKKGKGEEKRDFLIILQSRLSNVNCFITCRAFSLMIKLGR